MISQILTLESDPCALKKIDETVKSPKVKCLEILSFVAEIVLFQLASYIHFKSKLPLTRLSTLEKCVFAAP